jgi:hypothetical protein
LTQICHLYSNPSTPLPPLKKHKQDVLDESARLAADATAQLNLGGGAEDAGADGPETRLWVDKYAPNGFTQLLSDEWVNREVAKWTRSWLPGARPDPAAEEEEAQQQGGGGGAFGQKRKWGAGGGGGGGRGGGRWRRKGITRQEAPVLLICGPPGGCWVCDLATSFLLSSASVVVVVFLGVHCGVSIYGIFASPSKTTPAAANARTPQVPARPRWPTWWPNTAGSGPARSTRPTTGQFV